MFLLYRYKRKGLPFGLIKLHEFLLEDIISYFERDKFIKKRVKLVRKTVKQALGFAKKNKSYPSKKTDQSLELLEELLKEVDNTHQVLKEAAIEMENMINQIREERVANIFSLINTAREHFIKKELEKGVELLKEAQNELGKKLLLKTRKNIIAGIDSEIKKIKSEIEKKQKKDNPKLPDKAEHTT